MPVLSTLRERWNNLSDTQQLLLGASATCAALAGGYYMWQRTAHQHDENDNNNTREWSFSPAPNNHINNNAVPSFDDSVDGRYVSTLNETELANWLTARGLPKNVVDSLTRQHHVDGAVFVRLTPDLVDEMQLPSVGGRVRLGELVMRCRESLSVPPTPRREPPSASPSYQPQQQQVSTSNSPVPPWRAATHQNAGSIQRAQQEAQQHMQQEQQPAGEKHVLNRLIAAFKELSHAEFVRLPANTQHSKIRDANELLNEAQDFLGTLDANRAAPFTEIVGRFRLLIELLSKHLEALEQGGGSGNNNSTNNNQQQDAAHIQQNLDRLARALAFINSEHYTNNLADQDKTTVLDQAAKMYEELVAQISASKDQDIQKHFVPQLLKAQEVLARAASQIGASPPSSVADHHQNSHHQCNHDHDDSSSPAGSLQDLFNFFASDEFETLPLEQKRRALEEAEKRLVLMVQATMKIPSEEERARIAPAIERLSDFLARLKNFHLRGNNNASSHPPASAMSSKKSSPQKQQQQQEQVATNDQDEEEELEDPYDAPKLNGTTSRTAAALSDNVEGDDEEDENEDNDNNQEEENPNIRASFVLLRDMISAVRSHTFFDLSREEQVKRVRAIEKVYKGIIQELATYTETARKPFLPLVNDFARMVEMIKDAVIDGSLKHDEDDELPVSADARRAASERHISAPSRESSAPRTKRVSIQQQQQDTNNEEENEEEHMLQQINDARQREQQQKVQQSEETQRDLKSLFEVFRFMSSPSFDELPHSRKVELLRTAKILLENQLERVEGASESERMQLAPILERMVDILGNVNQLVTEQQAQQQQQQQQQSQKSETQTQTQQQQKDPLFIQALRQVSSAFSLISSEEFPQLPEDRQREITKETQRLVLVASQLIEKEATPEEKEQYSPLISKIAQAIGLTRRGGDDEEKEQEQQQPALTAPAAAGPLPNAVEQLITVFKMIVSEDFSKLPTEKKDQVLKLAQQLMEHNIRLLQSNPALNMVSKDERERYGPIVLQVAGTFKKLGLLAADADISIEPSTSTSSVDQEQQQQQDEEDEEEQEEPASATADPEVAGALQKSVSQLLSVFKMIASSEFSQLPDDKKVQIIKLAKELLQHNVRILNSDPALGMYTTDERKQFAPVIAQVADTFKKLGILDENSDIEIKDQVQSQSQPAKNQQQQQQQSQPQEQQRTIAMEEPMMRLVQTFRLIVSDDFDKVEDAQKIQIINLCKNLAETNVKILSHATKEDQTKFAPMLEKIVKALKELGLFDGQLPSAPSQQEQQEEKKTPEEEQQQKQPQSIAMAEPLMKLAQTFQILVSENFNTIPAEEQKEAINVCRRLALTNIRIMPHASAEDKKKFGPILDKIIGSLKNIGILEEKEIQQSSASTVSPPQPAPRTTSTTTSTSAAAVATAATTDDDEKFVSVKEAILRLVQMFQLIVSDKFGELPTPQQLQVMKASKDLVEIVLKSWPRAVPAERAQFGAIFEKVLSAMKKLSIVAPETELPAVVTSAAPEEEETQTVSTSTSTSTEDNNSAKNAAATPPIPMEKPMKQLVNTFKIIISEGFSKLPDEKKVQVMQLCQQLAGINIKLLETATPEDKEEFGPALEQILSALRKIGLLDDDQKQQDKKSQDDDENDDEDEEDEDEEAQAAAATEQEKELEAKKRDLDQQIKDRRAASEDFEALSSLFNEISKNPRGFTELESAQRRAKLVKGLSLIERCAKHLQTVPSSERESLIPVLSQMQQFFKQMANVETANAQKELAERAKQDKLAEEEEEAKKKNGQHHQVPPQPSHVEEVEDEEEEENEEDEENEEEGTDVSPLNDLIGVMQQLTNPAFADLPSEERKKLLQQGKLTLMAVHRTINQPDFPKESRERIGPLVQKFATLIQAVAQAEASVGEAENEVATTTNEEDDDQQQEEERKKEQQTETASLPQAVPSGSVERLMELYKMICSPQFQQMPVDVQTRSLKTITDLASLVQRAVQHEQNPVLKQKIESFLERVAEVVGALEANLENLKNGNNDTTAAGDDEQEEEENEEEQEDEEGEEENDDEQQVEGEAELVSQLDSLLDIIRSKDTISAVQSTGPRRVRILQVIGDVINDCQSQINQIGARGKLYQGVLNQVKEAKSNLEGIAAVSGDDNEQTAAASSSSEAADQEIKNVQQKRDNMVRAREISRSLGIILEALNSDKLLAMPDEARQELLAQIAQSITSLKEQAQLLEDAEKQALLPSLNQVENFVKSIAQVSNQGAETEEVNDDDDDEDESSSAGASDDPPPELSGDDAIRNKLLGQLQRIDDVISSPSFAAAPLDVRRQTARAIFAQLQELRGAAKKVLDEDDLESFEMDTADLVARLQELIAAESPSSNNNKKQQQEQTASTSTSTNTNNNADDDDDDQQEQQNGGREKTGKPAADTTSEAATAILQKCQQFFGILNSPAFTQASEEAREKIAAEIMNQAKTLLHVCHQRLSKDEREEVDPIVTGIIRMCRAISEPEGEERDEESSSDNDDGDDDQQSQPQQPQKQSQQRSQQTSKAASPAAVASAPASASGSPNNNNNKSRSISQQQQQQQSPSPVKQQQQQIPTLDEDGLPADRSEAEDECMSELLSIAKALQTPNLSLPEDEIAAIAERVEHILETELKNWRAVPELKSLVRFITAQLSRLTKEREESVANARRQAQQEEEQGEEPYSEGDEDQEEDAGEQKSASPSNNKNGSNTNNNGQKTALEQRLYNLVQQIITNSDKITSEAQIAPFATALQSLRPSVANFTEREARLFHTLEKQVETIARNVSHVEEVTENDNDDDNNKKNQDDDDVVEDEQEEQKQQQEEKKPSQQQQQQQQNQNGNGNKNNSNNNNNKQQKQNNKNKKKRGGRKH